MVNGVRGLGQNMMIANLAVGEKASHFVNIMRRMVMEKLLRREEYLSKKSKDIIKYEKGITSLCNSFNGIIAAATAFSIEDLRYLSIYLGLPSYDLQYLRMTQCS